MFLENTAPYAWAIKAGIDSRGDNGKEIQKKVKKRIANELMVKPLRRRANKLVKVYTDSLMKLQK